ncbi:Nitrite and sulphite reductase 4Fe-4S domain [Dissulfuribacter thermophilus]|uniref:Nitrite and sulphite reductase 4Fe-4S domain n=1 Tax=Dissulfuribacter thermophilus TaxID=1156395 RepID=A0A1B9F2K9_9BACT|nr:hypothetical protein [Dissulfuribacter thermophilus]OCC14166.1 Nitrite and sulphite reductase 4Fe-4S domain [Dissulfuribacter thermophilus]
MEEKKIPGIVPQKDGSYMISFELPNGACLSPEALELLAQIGREHNCLIHVTTAQKIMLLGMDFDQAKDVLERLDAAGLSVRKARDLSQPRVCVGKPYCKLALKDTFALSKYLYDRLSRKPVAPKLKVAVSGCPACCSWANMVDVGFVGVRSGWKVFIGGHGGARPKLGEEMGKVETHEEAAALLERIAELFTSEVKKKARLEHIIKRIGLETFKEKVGL